jgi:chorismate synthase
MKPLATLARPVMHTVDVVTKEDTVSFRERTDATAVPAMGVVAETMVAIVLADPRRFGSSAGTRSRSSSATTTDISRRSTRRPPRGDADRARR